MTLALIGVNHRTAPIELRERIAISREDLPDTTRALAAMPGVSECMIVSTCNRVELLAAVDSPTTSLTGFLESQFGIEAAQIEPHIYEYRDTEAVNHLFRMAASLDSMVVGEPQILGQVKEAFAVAKASGTVAGQLEHCIRRGQESQVRDRDWLELGFDRFSRRGSGTEDLRIAAGENGLPCWCGKDERACGAAPGAARSGRNPGDEPYVRTGTPHG
jgi:glutamyl-tRNA reductase